MEQGDQKNGVHIYICVYGWLFRSLSCETGPWKRSQQFGGKILWQAHSWCKFLREEFCIFRKQKMSWGIAYYIKWSWWFEVKIEYLRPYQKFYNFSCISHNETRVECFDYHDLIIYFTFFRMSVCFCLGLVGWANCGSREAICRHTVAVIPV